MYKYRLWSTIEARSVLYVDRQNIALFVFNNPRMQVNASLNSQEWLPAQFDRIDYRADGELLWRYVDPEVLNRVTIEDIHEVDLRRDRSRALIYLLGGLTFAVIGTVWALVWL